MVIRTRFAPSPTGSLHIGGARTALFSWAYARRHQGEFVLRIEDTDLERSSEASVQTIFDGLRWLGIEADAPPIYQTQRMDRYRQAIEQLLANGQAYDCYMPSDELDALREAQRARGEKPRYDGRWRPENREKMGLTPPADAQPVIRFRNPETGTVSWHDQVKGNIAIANTELDDLIIARADGTPTYNFCVCVDDWDMGITHVIRGDDHINNTPRQINILKALGAPIPEYAHLSMILGHDGQKLSKRHGAVSVMAYDEAGYLPEAIINYLARLGWSHGDDEIFSREQFATWFELDHITPSAAQFNPEKLNWINAHYIKQLSPQALKQHISQRFALQTIRLEDYPQADGIIALYQERVQTLVELANIVADYLTAPIIPADILAQHINDKSIEICTALQTLLATTEWQAPQLNAAVKTIAAQFGVKMPQVAIPLRVALLATPQTPSFDHVMVLLGREQTLKRLARIL